MEKVARKNAWEEDVVYGFTTSGEHGATSAEQLSYKDLWLGFKGRTTAHGVSPIADARGPVKKVVWVLIIITMVALTSNTLREVITEFTVRPVNVIIKMERKSDLVFPAVTFCNINPTRRSQLNNSPLLNSVFDGSGVSDSRRKRAVTRAAPTTDTTTQSLSTSERTPNSTTTQASTVGAVTSSARNIVTTPNPNIFSCNESNTNYTSSDGVLTSPNWPSNYEDFTHCIYMLSVGSDSGSKIILNITEYDIEGHSSCTYDYLEVHDGHTNDLIGARLCGSGESVVEGLSHSVMITFHTDLSVAKKGWRIVWSSQTEIQNTTTTNPDTTTSVTQVDTTTENVSTSTTTTTTSTALSNLTTSFIVQDTTVEGSNSTSTTVVTTTTNSFPANLGNKSTSEQVVTSPSIFSTSVASSTEAKILTSQARSSTLDSAVTSMPTTHSTFRRAIITNQPTAAALKSEDLNFGVADESLGEPTAEFKVSQKFTETLAMASPEEKIPLGHQSEDFILECSYRGRKCKDISTMFHKFFNPTHGNCFTFNSGMEKEEKNLLKSYKSGRQFGLKLTLNIEVDDYITDLADSAGIRLLIHNPYNMPFVEDEGLSLSPGRANLIGIKKVLVDHLDEPFSKCLVDLQNQEDVDAYQEIYRTNYTTQACQKTCYQAAVIAECGCADALYPTTGKALNIPAHLNQMHPPICSSDDRNNVLCLRNIATQFEANRLDCSQCKDPCREEMYKYSLSSSIWPSEEALNKTIQHLSKLSSKVANIDNTAKFRESFLKVNVFYEDLNQESYSERPAIPIDTLMANIGGALGLFIGMSFVTVFEFVEFIVDLIVLAIYKAKYQTKTDPVSTKV